MVGELHLEIICDRLKQQFKLEVTCGRSYVAYRETLQQNDDVQYKQVIYDRTYGPKRLYAGLDFIYECTGLNILPIIKIEKELQSRLSAEELNSILEGLEASLHRGPKGYPIVGINIIVKDIYRDHDTTSGAIRACISLFIKELLSDVHQQLLLEPLMSVEIEVPEIYVGDILSDLTVQRRGQIKEIHAGTIIDKQKHVISAIVPLSSMLGYATTLRSRTHGEGSFASEYYSHAAIDLSVISSLHL